MAKPLKQGTTVYTIDKPIFTQWTVKAANVRLNRDNFHLLTNGSQYRYTKGEDVLLTLSQCLDYLRRQVLFVETQIADLEKEGSTDNESAA